MYRKDPYTQEEKDKAFAYMVEHETASNPDIARHLGRTDSSVRGMMSKLSHHITWTKLNNRRACWVYESPENIARVTVLNAGPENTITFNYERLFERLRKRREDEQRNLVPSA